MSVQKFVFSDVQHVKAEAMEDGQSVCIECGTARSSNISLELCLWMRGSCISQVCVWKWNRSGFLAPHPCEASHAEHHHQTADGPLQEALLHHCWQLRSFARVLHMFVVSHSSWNLVMICGIWRPWQRTKQRLQNAKVWQDSLLPPPSRHVNVWTYFCVFQSCDGVISYADHVIITYHNHGLVFFGSCETWDMCLAWSCMCWCLISCHNLSHLPACSCRFLTRTSWDIWATWGGRQMSTCLLLCLPALLQTSYSIILCLGFMGFHGFVRPWLQTATPWKASPSQVAASCRMRHFMAVIWQFSNVLYSSLAASWCFLYLLA